MTVPLPGWRLRHADTNCRSPRDILDYLNRLITLERRNAAGSALADSEVASLTCADTASLLAQTR